MVVHKEISELTATLEVYRDQKNSVGFVPTMGALHEGHVSLVDQAAQHCDKVVVSVFVNPLQFNEKSDYENYPVVLEEDMAMLEGKCDVLFVPNAQEMFADYPLVDYDFGLLSTVLEAEKRPGHFKGVANVLKRFFELIQPDVAFFGEKDFQQLLVVKALVKAMGAPIQIAGCPIVREADGLAMSSRNRRLSQEQKRLALKLSNALTVLKESLDKVKLEDCQRELVQQLEADSSIQLEYLEVANAETLEFVNSWEQAPKLVALIAARVGEVRLIDNMRLN